MSLAVVAWDDPALAALREEQQAELAGRYGGSGDLVSELPPTEMLATVAIAVDGELVGCGSVRDAAGYGHGYGEIKRMYVRPDARGRGLSRAVLRHLEREATGRGLRRLILETGLLQPEAIGLYRSAGYRRIPTYGPYVVDPMSVCYARWLVPDVGARVLVVNGTGAAAATTVAAAAADLLRERGVPHGFVDLDALRRTDPTVAGGPLGQAVALDHLAGVAGELARRGHRHLVLAGVVGHAADRELYESACDGAEVAVVRLTAPDAILDVGAADAADAAVADDGDRPPSAVAADVLAAAGWLTQA